MGKNTIMKSIASALLSVLITASMFGCTNNPEGVVKKYLTAKTYSDRIEYVLDAAAIKPKFENHYVEGKVVKSLNDLTTTSAFTKMKTVREESDFAIVSVNIEGEDIPYLTRKVDGKWKVDWEFSVNFNPMAASTYKALRPTEHFIFRAEAKLCDYFNYEFRNAKFDYYCIAMRAAKDVLSNLDPMPYGYIKRNSKDGQELFELLKDGVEHNVVVKTAYLYRSEGDNVLIKRYFGEYRESYPKPLPFATDAISEHTAVEGCIQGSKRSGVYRSCQAGRVFTDTQKCVCDTFRSQENFQTFCKNTVQKSRNICLISSETKEEYSACMHDGLMVRSGSELDMLFDGCKNHATK